VDVKFLLKQRYNAGIPQAAGRPPLGSAAAFLLSNDRSVYARVPGYRLLYESHPSPGLGLYRLYDLDDTSAR